MSPIEARKILGVDRNSSVDDIKTAYRKLAMLHHPDRGGDADQFKKVKEAYETLEKTNRSVNSFNDGNFNHHHISKRRVNIFVPITESEALIGCFKTIVLPVNPNIGKQIKINPGVGEDKYIGIFEEENVVYFIFVKIKCDFNFNWGINDPKRGDVYRNEMISPFKMIMGGWHEVATFDGSKVNIRIPQGLEANKLLKIKEKGYLRKENGTTRGDMYLRVIPEIKKISEYSSKEIENIKLLLDSVKND